MEAISHAGTAVGILSKEGVVLAAEKKVTSKLLETKAASEKMYRIDDHIACAVAGITADANIVINYARLTAQRHLFQYQEPSPVEGALFFPPKTSLAFLFLRLIILKASSEQFPIWNKVILNSEVYVLLEFPFLLPGGTNTTDSNFTNQIRAEITEDGKLRLSEPATSPLLRY